ncbi:hypothetical protein B0O99DRAFT_591276 [Bisporella sp. PMI_857]|nr:hypothetical protein B0O99DRAFT_591276 [Bisporella sp. PMI_857]
MADIHKDTGVASSQPQVTSALQPELAAPSQHAEVGRPQEAVVGANTGAGAIPAQELPSNPIQPLQAAPPAYVESYVPQKQQPQNPDNQQMVTPLHLVSIQPTWIDCPYCRKRTMTRTEEHGEGMQIVVGAVLCLICICLAVVPCVAHWFEETEVYCSDKECNKIIGVIPHGGQIQLRGVDERMNVPSVHPAPQQPPMVAQPQH